MVEEFRAMLAQAGSHGRRSTALSPLAWFIALMGSVLVLVSREGYPDWLRVGMFVLLVLGALIFAGSFVYFAKKKPDLLRSETYSIQKLAIQKGYVGDSAVGLIKIEEQKELGDAKSEEYPA